MKVHEIRSALRTDRPVVCTIGDVTKPVRDVRLRQGVVSVYTEHGGDVGWIPLIPYVSDLDALGNEVYSTPKVRVLSLRDADRVLHGGFSPVSEEKGT